MLIRAIYSRALTNVITYSYELKKEPVQKYFDNNFKTAREQINKVTNEFKMSKLQSRRLFHYFPQVFKPETKQFNQFKNRVEFIRKLSDEQGRKGIIGKILNQILFDSDHLAFKFKIQQYENLIETINKYFQGQEQIIKILTQVPNLANKKIQFIMRQKLSLVCDYLGISNQEAMKIFQQSPFLLVASTKKLRQSITTMHKVFGFSKEQIIQQMKSMGQVYLIGGPNLVSTYRTPIQWGLTKQYVKEAFLKHPLLYFNFPQNIMPPKRRIFKYLNFTTEMARKMFKDFPQILIWSVRSLEEKALFINNRLQLKLNQNTMQLLTFNFNKTLRPRGQILVRSKQPYNNSNILEFMKISNEQFASRTAVSRQRLQQQIDKFPITLQMDFKMSKVNDKIRLKQKILKLSQAYQH